MVTSLQFEELLRLYDDYEINEQLNIYYDTTDRKIQALRAGMRIRYKNNKYIFTLKIKHHDDHIELEKEIPHDNINEIQHDETIAAWLKEYDLEGPFVEIGRVHTLRYIHRTDDAEICFDKNHYNGITDYEIEYEFLQDHDGLKCFNELLAHVHVTFKKNCISKIGRMVNTLCHLIFMYF